MNSGDLQNRISPHASKQSLDLTDAKVSLASDKDPKDANKTSFKDMIMNANADQARARAAQKNGNEMSAAKTDAEFAAAMANKLNQAATRKPGGNQLDKDAFLKLFITQVQNQDPLKPDDSSAMAAQLAQFDGLEQMMNVNKNLEKMQKESETSRAVGLINFVGKDLKLDGGKLAWRGGKITESQFNLDRDTSRTTLEVRDSAGIVIATQDLGQQAMGEHKLEWDGKSKDGKTVGEGVYTFAIVAKDLQNVDVDARITSNVKVTGVDLKDAGGSFYTDIGKVGMAEVASVGDKGFVSRARAGDAVKETAALVPVEEIELAMKTAEKLMQENSNDPAAMAKAQELIAAAQQAQQQNTEIEAAMKKQAAAAGPAPLAEIAVPSAATGMPPNAQAAAQAAAAAGMSLTPPAAPAAPAKPQSEPPPSGPRLDPFSKPSLSATGGIQAPSPRS